MDKEAFELISEDLLERASDIRDKKLPAYAENKQDILNKFKESAVDVDVSPEKVWLIFFSKHIAAIKAWAKDPTSPQSEPIEERFCDAINFLLLAHGLEYERKFGEPKKQITDEK